MGEIIGLGTTHMPALVAPDDAMTSLFEWTLGDPDVPDAFKSSTSWPPPMKDEFGSDRGRAAAGRHRKALVEGFRAVRERLDSFQPDVVLIWGDDQYENFREEVVPAFCVLAYNDLTVLPWEKPVRGSHVNVWNEPPDHERRIRGARQFGKYLTTALLDNDIDVAYSYSLRAGQTYPHAFLNTVLYLDYDRHGFDFPVLPMSVNCYGRYVIARRGRPSRIADEPAPELCDPPSPSPGRCLTVGAAVAEAVAASSERVALVASSGWSHAFLHDATGRVWPDVDLDRKYYEALRLGDFEFWKSTTRADIELHGQQEMLNWFCLVGAMDHLGIRASWSNFVPTYLFNSNVCFAVFDRMAA